ncbi:MAG: universal stress protein [Bryobacteraceae bacterium]|nr:universal stress protein [Solibacteraceae bacterium]MCO5351506.1 universal stress protein [Bryobacteraceae bacterium]
MLTKLLLPVDFSARSLKAAEYARYLAQHSRCEVVLLHVHEPARHPEQTPPEAGLPALKGILCDASVRAVELSGDPAACILDYAAHYQPDLILMPTHGYGVLRRFLLGSVTAKILHDSEFPVWTGVHGEAERAATTFHGIQHVVCAVDLGPPSEHALRWAARFATAFDARLTIVHASPQLVPVIGVVHDDEWRAHVYNALQNQMAALLEKAGVVADTRLVPGDAPTAVIDQLTALDGDVLVIGRSPHGMMGRLRTAAYALIRQSPRPVISI